jgi:hypothetical protein
LLEDKNYVATDGETSQCKIPMVAQGKLTLGEQLQVAIPGLPGVGVKHGIASPADD